MEFKSDVEHMFRLAKFSPDLAVDYHRQLMKELDTAECLRLLYAIEKHKPPKLYRYMITFTIDPKKHTTVPIQKIEDYIESQVTRKALGVQRFEYCREHDETNIHWHVNVVTDRAIRSDAFNQYSKNYGFVQISRSKDTNAQHGSIYLNKEDNFKRLL